MSTAVYRRIPVAAARMKVFERIKIYRDAAGAAPTSLEPRFTAKPLNKALDSAVQEVNFLEIDMGKPQPVNQALRNKSRDLDPYLSPFIRDLSEAFF
jgi:hypothetical protein